MVGPGHMRLGVGVMGFIERLYVLKWESSLSILGWHLHLALALASSNDTTNDTTLQ